ncbi:MAG: hypothetical protein IJK63_10035 [Oscillospiraceae bacterium]|nr:hypothetical protein [Oscillospiraceae bacterium]
MTDREKFQAVFGRLHASADTMTEVKKRMNPETNRKPRRLTKKAVALALAAALLLALGVTAYATGLFGINIRPATEEELELGAYPVWDEEGNVDYEAGPQYPSEGLTFSLSTDGPVYQTEFRPGWLPTQPNHGYQRGTAADVIAQEGKPWDPEDWYSSVSFDTGATGSDGDLGIRYQIFDANLRPGLRLTLMGEYRIVKTETWDDLSVTEVEMLYTDFRGQENYVLLFSESRGFLIVVGGSNDLETLEHIARELEIRQTDVPVIDTGSTQGLINIGRG